MAGICWGVFGESDPLMDPISMNSGRRRLDLVPFMFATESSVVASLENARKRRRSDLLPIFMRHCYNPMESGEVVMPVAVGNEEGKEEEEEEEEEEETNGWEEGKEGEQGSNSQMEVNDGAKETGKIETESRVEAPRKFGMTSVCGWRRDMEDAVSIHPLFSNNKSAPSSGFHFFAVFDGHGCSHVAMNCKDRFHKIMEEEIESYRFRDGEVNWKATMERSFQRMDREVSQWPELATRSCCRCHLQSPERDTVGTTAVIAVVTPDKVIVANCGDSRAVLCRNGSALPLSSDHKPERPDELDRIQLAGGRVIYWEGARVLGVLAMSRAIGDDYLKPFVISEPEVVIMDRTAEDECLILASDGLWDVVTNETACGVARMCLKSQKLPSRAVSEVVMDGGTELSIDKACCDASILLTKLALARRTSDNVSVVVVDLKKSETD